MKSIIFIVKCHVFPYDLLVSLGCSNSILKKKLPSILSPHIASELDAIKDRGAAYYFMFSGGQSLLYLKEVPGDIESLSVLQHEIFHAAEFILKKAGVRLSDKSDEAYAYLIQYLTKEIYRQLPIFSSQA